LPAAFSPRFVTWLANSCAIFEAITKIRNPSNGCIGMCHTESRSIPIHLLQATSLSCGQLCFGRLLPFAEPHRHSHDLGRNPCGVGQRTRRSASRHGSHPASLAL